MKQLLTPLLTLLLTLSLFGQELNQLHVVGKGEFLPGELIARSDENMDANGQLAAGLLIVSDIGGFTYSPWNGLVKDVVHRGPGEDLLFLSPTERRVDIYKAGYEKLPIILYDYGINLQSGKVWQLKITGDKILDLIPITIKKNPEDATVFIDGEDKGTGTTFQVSGGKRKIRIEKKGYSTIEKEIDVTTKNIYFSYNLSSIDPMPVKITSQPSGAEVYLNNENIGTTPSPKFQYPGKYNLRLKLAGYLPFEKEIEVKKDGDNTFNFKLTKNAGYLEIKVNPKDSEININGEQKEPGLIELKPGSYKISITKSKYLPVEEEIEIGLGKTITRSYELIKNTGMLELKYKPSDVKLMLNKEDYSGQRSIKLAPGTYKIEIEKEGYYGEEEVIEIKLGEKITKQYELRQKTGSLQFSITPFNAEVILKNGAAEIDKWEGLKLIKDIQVGRYTIEAKASGYKTYKKEIQIKEHEKTIIEAQMEEGSDGPELVYVRGGTFNMGSESGDNDEKPIHSVTLDDFYIGKYEVTAKEFSEFIESTGYLTDADKGGGSYIWTGKKWKKKSGINWKFNAEGEKRSESEMNHPVIYVSWNDAVTYCNWFSSREGLEKFYEIEGAEIRMKWGSNGYRLPTEAEWEYAAGNSSKHTKYSWGNGMPVGKEGGNVADESAKREFSDWTIFEGYDDGYIYTSPVGIYRANELDLYDMTGNVWEWCNDWYNSEYYYTKSPSNNPKGPKYGSNRVLRGGSWNASTDNCRSANRNSDYPRYSYNFIGFRISRTP